MDHIIGILFAVKGRIPRQTYWIILLAFFFLSIGVSGVDNLLGNVDPESNEMQFTPLSVAFHVVAIICMIIVSIKRLHDMNRSGWFVLIAIIPIIGLIAVIWMGVVKGIDGDNQYGKDPLKI